MKNKLISIVLPVFNEARGLPLLYSRLRPVMDVPGFDFEVIFVNDGSVDGTFEVLAGFHAQDARVKIIDLSRNFGHQNALMAGIDHAAGDAVILMDADLEDDPAAIPSFLDLWGQGYAVVYARRAGRQVPWFEKACFDLFHKINQMISRVQMDATGIFCLMDRKVVGHLRKLTETDRYIPGLRAWIGFRQIGIDVPRGMRAQGSSRVGFRRLFKLAFDSFTAFSTAPLKVSMVLGILFSFLSLAGIMVVVVMKLWFKVAIQGWASTISIILLLGGVQLICIWLQGEYLARIFNEVKNRPLYIVNGKIGFGGED